MALRDLGQVAQRVGVDLTTEELTALGGGIGGVSITIDDEGDEAANSFRCSMQLTDTEGDNFTGRGTVKAYLSTQADGSDVAATPPTGAVTVSTGLQVIEHVAKKVLEVQSDGVGLIEIDAVDAGTPTLYWCVILPDGSLRVGPAMTWA